MIGIMNIDREFEREAQKVRASLPTGVKGRVRVLSRRVEAVPGEPWFEVFIASGDMLGCELSFELEIKSGDAIELELPPAGNEAPKVVEGRVEWVRKNAMPILGRYSCRVNIDTEKEKKGFIK